MHGGERFTESCLVTPEMMLELRKLIELAPLHNPHNIRGINAAFNGLPGVPNIAVFDTAFHHKMPDYAYIYPLPYILYKKYRIRRYGFHGMNHHFVSKRAGEMLGKPREELKIITAHLGNGASITAVDRGISVDTSMGFTPLEGLMMGTRCGDIDPAIILHMMGRKSCRCMKPTRCSTSIRAWWESAVFHPICARFRKRWATASSRPSWRSIFIPTA